ncbi:MAG: hypothetical protein M3P26_12405 [Gemmatimonadota bacterium]|nr:hypothetical protein [Gemmatimonadota bacterium]
MIEDESIKSLAYMVREFSSIAGEITPLGLACFLREDPEQLELLEWLQNAPSHIMSRLPSLEALLAQLGPTPGTDDEIHSLIKALRAQLKGKQNVQRSSGRVLPFPRTFNNAAWLKEVERARGKVHP